MTEMSTQHGTFSRQGIAVSQEESPGFSRGEDVKELLPVMRRIRNEVHELGDLIVCP